jgi:ABC-type molybdate transport system permease subunit
MTADMLHVMEWHNGEKAFSPFSAAEMARRHAALRDWVGKEGVDAVLLTAHHGVAYFSGWLHCALGRRYGMVVTQEAATTISAGIDGGHPWRQSVGQNVTYSDWRRDNFYRAVRQLTPRVRLAIEFDHVSLDFRSQLDLALPGVEFADVGQAAMWMRLVKSPEEQTLIREGARIADLAGEACVAILTSVLAFPCAYAIAFKLSDTARRWAVFLMVIPFFTSYLVRVYSWQIFLSDAGIINVMLGWVGLGPFPMLNTVGATTVGFLTLCFPLVVLLQLFSLVFIDRTLIEAAHNMRCGRLRTVFEVIIPSARVGLTIAALFAFILCFGDFVSPIYLGGGDPRRFRS